MCHIQKTKQRMPVQTQFCCSIVCLLLWARKRVVMCKLHSQLSGCHVLILSIWSCSSFIEGWSISVDHGVVFINSFQRKVNCQFKITCWVKQISVVFRGFDWTLGQEKNILRNCTVWKQRTQRQWERNKCLWPIWGRRARFATRDGGPRSD